jgi:hypothetical protein
MMMKKTASEKTWHSNFSNVMHFPSETLVYFVGIFFLACWHCPLHQVQEASEKKNINKFSCTKLMLVDIV